jgi:hypothetical protein
MANPRTNILFYILFYRRCHLARAPSDRLQSVDSRTETRFTKAVSSLERLAEQCRRVMRAIRSDSRPSCASVGIFAPHRQVALPRASA